MSSHSNEGPWGGADRPRQHTRTSDAEQAILAATERLLGETSLQELSVAQIIAAAGVSRATFYFYFGSKFAVLTALVDKVIGEIYEVGRQFVDRTRELPIAASMPERIQSSAAVWAANRSVLQAAVENWNAVPELRAVWPAALGRLTDGLAAEIERERAGGRAPAGPDSRHLAATLVWTTERCLYIAGLGLEGALADDAGTVQALTQIWLGALYGGQAAAA